MNGRVYDYNLGRFLSVDPFIQEPGNSQSMNPYSYIMNNPLSGKDPSGYTGVLDHYVAGNARDCSVMNGGDGCWGPGGPQGQYLKGSNENGNSTNQNATWTNRVTSNVSDLMGQQQVNQQNDDLKGVGSTGQKSGQESTLERMVGNLNVMYEGGKIFFAELFDATTSDYMKENVAASEKILNRWGSSALEEHASGEGGALSFIEFMLYETGGSALNTVTPTGLVDVFPIGRVKLLSKSDDLVDVWHFTDKKGYNAIKATGETITIRMSKPPGGNPSGAYFSKVSPDELYKMNKPPNVTLGKIGKAKTEYVFQMKVPRSILNDKDGKHDYITFSKSDVVSTKGMWVGGKNPHYKK